MAIRISTLLLILIVSQGCSSPPPTSLPVVISGKTFTLELNLDTQSRAEGMMHRSTFNKDCGMLFVFPDSIERSFWMKNCFVDIDLIFLDSRGTITAVHEMDIEPPQSTDESIWEYEGRLNHYWSQGPSRFAIELEAGSIQDLELRVNDRIMLDLNYLKLIAR